MTDGRRTVLHFIGTVGPGGAETIFLQLASQLGMRGWDPRVALVGPGWVMDRARELGLAVGVVESTRRLDLRHLLGLREMVRQHRVGLIHAHLFSPAVYSSAVGAWTGTPVVATFHGVGDTKPGGWGRRLRYRLLDRRATIVCVSEFLRDQLLAAGGVHRSSTRVIPNGLDVDAFRGGDGPRLRAEHGIPDDAVLVGALGNIRPAKDFATLIRAAGLFASERRLAFAIVGDCAEPLYTELRKLRDRLGLRDRLSFWGFRQDVSSVMAAFDVLAISSSTEGFSLAAVQAMAAGTPVVATRSGGPEQIITNGEDGLLVPVGAPDALAAAIRRLVEHPELRARLARRAEAMVRQRFSLKGMVDAYERLYAELAGFRDAPVDGPDASFPGGAP